LSFFGFAAEYAGKPLISPYLEPNADHSHGANFGSGGAGVLLETHQGLVHILTPKEPRRPILASCFFQPVLSWSFVNLFFLCNLVYFWTKVVMILVS